MKIFITTLGRVDNQTTLKNLLGTNRNITLVVQDHEYKEHKNKYASDQVKVIALPKEIKTLGPTRKYMLETFNKDKIILLDDDLEFSYRDINRKIIKSKDPIVLNNMLDKIEQNLEVLAHVGIISKALLGQSKNKPEFQNEYKENTKCVRFLAYNTSLFPEGLQFGRVDIMSDYDLTLQLLKKGYPNIVLLSHCQQDPGANTKKGGCTEQRNAEKHKIERLKMIGWHSSRICQHGETPFSLKCQWQKAWKDFGIKAWQKRRKLEKQ